MTKKKVAEIWNIYFFSGFFILIIHYLRYLNSFLTGHMPWADAHGDYEYINKTGLILRFLLMILSIYFLKKRNKNIVLSTSFVWGLSFFLLSNEHDKYTFIITFFIFLITSFQAIWEYLKALK